MKNKAKELIEQYVERFDYHINDYKSGNYNESQARTDFINPFFEALGWDINNKAGLAESYREVIYEDKIKVGGSTKAPDYCFTVYGQKKFFVEAKKPKVNIKEQIEPAYQLRRYGWSAKLPISLITDFEEFAVYDCLNRPNPTDKASVGRIKYINYKDYIKEFDFIWDVFSKEQVLKGSFDRFVISSKGKKGTAGVDAEFLKSLDTWRDLIARNIVNRNANITEDELNFATQKLIDRLIFLRICEDRGVELENQLMGCVGKDSFLRLKQVFHIADQKYNSGLFDYKKDKITDTLSIDDKVLKDIIEDMYYPKSPYEFSVIPVEIMGHSYEQYLGKVMRITPGHRIKIEEKPEVRKAGGVYYTPEYIVNYIVENTVGKLIDGKTPEEISKIKICDPACGSGSFLLGAYQYLLNWHKNYYSEVKIKNKDKYITPEGNLTTSVKKQILLNNIFGVDIDTNAVEVTKLSLMLKAMEGETTSSINQQLSLMHDKVLPTLDDNIKSGNSLIDLDFYENELDFEPGMEKKIKPFNWQSAFPQVFKQGGFDAVIGNPPYLKERGNQEIFEPILKSRIGQLYHQGKMDYWYYFVHRGIDILRDNAVFGIITNSYWMKSDGASKLIKRIQKELEIKVIVNFDNYKVFKDVSGKHNIAIFKKASTEQYTSEIYSIIKDAPSDDIYSYEKSIVTNDDLFDSDKINIVSNFNIFKNFEILEKYFDVSQGVVEATDKISKNQLIKAKNPNVAVGTGVFVLNKNEIEALHFNNDEIKLLKPYVNTSHINRYSLNFRNEYLLYSGKSERKQIANALYPNIKKHLDNMREYITSSNSPYGIHRPREQKYFDNPKLICKGMFLKPEFFYDEQCYYCGMSFSVIIQKTNKYDLKYLLGLLNSKIAEHWFNKNGKKRGIGVDIGVKVFRLFPIPANPSSEAQAQLVKLVETMLQLNKDLQAATLPEQKEQLQARISYTDKKIDQLVYQLYELTEEEIKIVEGE